MTTPVVLHAQPRWPSAPSAEARGVATRAAMSRAEARRLDSGEPAGSHDESAREDGIMLLPNQTKPVARTFDATAMSTRLGAGLSTFTLPGEDRPVMRPPSPLPMGPVSPGVVDACQAMCAGNPSPSCWATCNASRSPWMA
jgi:hypothetical protein